MKVQHTLSFAARLEAGSSTSHHKESKEADEKREDRGHLDGNCVREDQRVDRRHEGVGPLIMY